MRAYYNENDAFAAQWLRDLMAEGEIADGDVDERSIEDVRPADLVGHERCHFFAGIAGWDVALQLAGWPEHRPVWTGSCPCQPFSSAGLGLGEGDERHLFPEWLRLIEECRPPAIFGEQVATPLGRSWLSSVFVSLENLGYACAGADLCAAGVGAPHIRQRLWWVAYTEWNQGAKEEPCGGTSGRMGRKQQSFPWNTSWEVALSELRALDHGLPRCVAGTDAARNAIVPQLAAEFIVACA